MSKGRYNFPDWTYGYTLGPGSSDKNGDYTQWQDYGNFYQQPGGYPHPGKTSSKEKPGKNPEAKKNDTSPTTKDTSTSAAGSVVKKEPAAAAPPPPSSGEAKKPPEEGEIVERPMTEILRGRNPIMFCNDQSKFRGLHMEWEQVSETGPPHNKTFTWSLKMGDMVTTGSANSKKSAKNKAAEEMVKKLDQLPRPMKRQHNHMNMNHMNPMMGGPPPPSFGGYPPHPGYFPPPYAMGGMPYRAPPPWWQQQQAKKRKREEEAAKAVASGVAPADNKPTLLNPSQNNPISKLYEYSKKRRLPEPLFDTIAENVLETKRTQQGFTLKKTEFTIQCSVNGQKFLGTAMTKKQAKYNAAAAAWAEVGVGVGQASIDSLLQSQRAGGSEAKK